MRREVIVRSGNIFVDVFILFSLAAIIYGIIAFANQWESSYNPQFEIDLSLKTLPLYSFFSSLRGLVAYIFSLVFTFIIGYWAAKSVTAEKIILPILDVMQSIPVLGFLPGLVLGLVSIFPKSNVGLELAAIIMIFTGQVWNMTFAFYSSIKGIPKDLKEAAAMMQLAPHQKLQLLELPYSAMNLTWNSMMSMAGGWFFLTVCEAFTLEKQDYRLPGLGAYMSEAINRGNTEAVIGAIVSMLIVIILFDIFLWKPALVWAHRFRLEDKFENRLDEPLIKFLIRHSTFAKVIRFVSLQRQRLRIHTHKRRRWFLTQIDLILNALKSVRNTLSWGIYGKVVISFLALLFMFFVSHRLWGVFKGLSHVHWLNLIQDTFFTFCRVFVAVLLSSLWTLPAGLWIAQSAQRLRTAQPIIQMMASFPAPMLYPLVLTLLGSLDLNFNFSSMILIILGVQWYILFNVLAGALKIPSELKMMMSLMKSNSWHQWRYLYLPSVLPSLVTGWITAAGGAWNASIVAEFISLKGKTFAARGLGADINRAASLGDFSMLAACLLIMVVVLVILNRTLWAKLFHLVQVRYRLDL